MADTTVLGRFLWHELMTTEPQAASAFYPKVTGWKTQAWEHNADYTLWVAPAGPAGGLMKLPESARAAGAKSHWLPYIGTPDIDASVNACTSAGALVLVQVSEIPNGGRYAVLADPQGAMFGLYGSGDSKVPGDAKQGEFSWHELAATDYKSAFAFYQKAFGWQPAGEHNMGDMGVYFMFGFGAGPVGGIYNKHANTPPHWMNYVLVNDVDNASKAAAAAGGQVLNGPMEVPGGEWIAQLSDPQGAVFAVHARTKAAVKSPPKAEAARTAGSSAQADKAKSAAPQKAKPAPKKAAAKAKPAAKTRSAKKAAKKIKKKAAKKVVRPAKKQPAKKARPAAKKKNVRKAAAKKKTAGKKKAARKK